MYRSLIFSLQITFYIYHSLITAKQSIINVIKNSCNGYFSISVFLKKTYSKVNRLYSWYIHRLYTFQIYTVGNYLKNKEKVNILTSSHWKCSFRKGGLRNFAKFPGKQLCQSIVFNKAVGLRPATLLKKRFWHRFFPVNFAKFIGTPFLQNTSGDSLRKVNHL